MGLTITPDSSVRFGRFPLIAGVLLLGLISASVLVAAEGSVAVAATVIGVEGLARQTTDGRTWELLEVGDNLRAGSLIQTGVTNTVLDLQLGEAQDAHGSSLNSDRVRLFENSVLGLKKLSVRNVETGSRREFELDLRSGQMQGVSAIGGLDYEVEFPVGVLGIRTGTAQSQPTSFLLRASGSVTVFSGTVVMSLADAQPVPRVLKADQRFDPTTRETTSLSAEAPERKLSLLPVAQP